MKKLRNLISLLLALCLCLGSFAYAENPNDYELGDTIRDFTMTTWDNKTITLSEVLKEKDAVLINIWASWCDPCRNEFPHMQAAYEQYSDKIEVIALSCEITDTVDVLEAVATEFGLTFPVGIDSVGLTSALNVTSIPMTLMVDRFGNICYMRSGSLPDTDSFIRLFDAFIGDSYTASVQYTDLPPAKANVAGSPEADLAAALNVEGGEIVFSNPADPYIWPMTVTKKDDRNVVASTTQGTISTTAQVNASVTAKAGDAIVTTFKTSTEDGFDTLKIIVNGETVKYFSGVKDWMTYAWAVPDDGEYEFAVAYTKDDTNGLAEDTVWVDSISVVNSVVAAAALAANPVYPEADELALTVISEGAQKIIIDDPYGALPYFFGVSDYYIINGDTATFKATLPAEIDPEIASFYSNYDASFGVVTNNIAEDGYIFSSGVDSIATTGYSFSNVALYYDANYSALVITYCKDAENVDSLIAMLNEYGAALPGTWSYAPVEEPAIDDGMSTYKLTFVDQNGDPVPGVMAQLCDEDSCCVFTSDENGVCEFTIESYEYKVYILKAPEGYKADTYHATKAPYEGGELNFVVTKQ